MAPNDDFNHVLIAKGAKQIVDAGGSVQLGAHGQLQGLGAHWELWMLQQGGMSPLEALRAATIDGARYLGLEADIGSSKKASSPTSSSSIAIRSRTSGTRSRSTSSC